MRLLPEKPVLDPKRFLNKDFGGFGTSWLKIWGRERML
jgi:hypothetical protein